VLTALQGAALQLAAAGQSVRQPPTLSILTFHSIPAQPDELFPGDMSAARFDPLLALLTRCFRVVTFGEALRLLQAGTLPARTLVLTFDDGYADNAQVVLPILQRHGLAGTFFVCTGYLDGARMWNDVVIDNLRLCGAESVDLGEFGLGRMPLADLSQRRAAIAALLPKVKYMSLQARVSALERIHTLCGKPQLPSARMMRPHQVVALHRAGMEVGAHTVNHPILTQCTDLQAEDEIAQGREQLQRLLDAPVDVFAYPNGRPGLDYDQRHVQMLRELGFRGAASTAPGAAPIGADRYQLPRYTPWARTRLTWAARLVANLRRTDYKLAPAG
jgi:peptidoglycan/xylan/chitin deacetylase (PgdA/CDA1 family)